MSLMPSGNTLVLRLVVLLAKALSEIMELLLYQSFLFRAVH